jgi:hypothetical protein
MCRPRRRRGAARRGTIMRLHRTHAFASNFGAPLWTPDCLMLHTSHRLNFVFAFRFCLPLLRRCRPQQHRSVAASGWASPALPSAAVSSLCSSSGEDVARCIVQ